MYKRAMVGMLEDEAEEEKEQDKAQPIPLNPDVQEYGDRLIEITGFSIIDNTGKATTTLIKGDAFTIQVKITSHIETSDPIVAFTIKDPKGTDITGTNTMFEGINVGNMSVGDERTISFKQNLDIQGGQYILSLGCTRYENDDFKVYHRLYDVCSIAVVSSKNTVGYYDMNSVVTVE
jgi:hypothetical protein